MPHLSRRTFIGAGVAAFGTAALSRLIPADVVAAPGVAASPFSSDPFGYGRAFDEALAAIGQISPAQLLARHPAPRYLDKLSWDPTGAAFFADLQKLARFKLDPAELAAYERNGFVVSQRLGGASFAEIYYQVFSANMPVFVSADSVLHAWHRSYDAVLSEIEETVLSPSLTDILGSMAGAVRAAHRSHGSGALRDSLADADVFIAVGRSLLAGAKVEPILGGSGRVGAVLAAVKGLALQRFSLFGERRAIDFSQFKVRGHYEKSDTLKRYFRAMMWLGRIDLRVAGDNGAGSPRQLGAAIALHDLLRRSGRFDRWADFDQMIQTFVGRTDSMTFAQLGVILKAAGMTDPARIRDAARLTALSEQIARSPVGAQQIRSHHAESSPLGPDRAALPRAFTFLGQKFTVDSWATGKVTADDIAWDGNKVQRRMASALDVAFAVLANDHVGPKIAARIGDARGVRFRDGLAYQHNLAAVRQVIDSHPRAAWRENIYMAWLATLRTLSTPMRGRGVPQVMQTRAWADRDLNTQLGSWAQLRHDTILYVKQSYSSGVTCFHPAGLVEPRPAFWGAMEALARVAHTALAKAPYPATHAATRQRHVEFFKRFEGEISRLRAIAIKQAGHAALTEAEARMLKDVIQISHGSGFTRYNGWYPGLFYDGRSDSGKYDALIADVHTDVPAPAIGDPGGVLHQGVGAIDLMLIAADCRGKRVAYAGPTLSHYELATRGVARISDSEWKKQLAGDEAPKRPEWTRSYLIAGVNPNAAHYE